MVVQDRSAVLPETFTENQEPLLITLKQLYIFCLGNDRRHFISPYFRNLVLVNRGMTSSRTRLEAIAGKEWNESKLSCSSGR